MPPSRFNRSAWPETGPHRELLEYLDAVHRRFGCRSLREVGRAMHLSYSRVHDIVRGVSLPVSEAQARSLVLALVGEDDSEARVMARQAVELYVKARRARDEGDTPAVLVLSPPDAPDAGAQDDGTGGSGADPADPVVPAAESSGSAVENPATVEDTVPGGRDALPLDGGEGRRFRWRRPRVLAAVLAGLVVLGAGVTVAVVATSPAPSPGGVVLQDAFESSSLDPGKWNSATRADLIYPGDGHLNFVIGPTDSAQGAEARVEPMSLDGYRSLSFVAGNPRVTTQGPGGVYLTLRMTDGRNHRLFFGPGSEGPEVAALVCSRSECHTYDDYDPPGVYVRFRPGEQVAVRIVQAGDGSVEFYARDQLIAQSRSGDAPLQTFDFSLYGAKSEAWHITVNSLIVSN